MLISLSRHSLLQTTEIVQLILVFWGFYTRLQHFETVSLQLTAILYRWLLYFQAVVLHKHFEADNL